MMAMAKTSGTPARRTGARATAKTTARTAQQPAPQTSGTARRARAVVCAAAIIVVLALVSAFGWPGWAVRTPPAPVEVPSAVASATPTIAAQPLPSDASELVKILPEHVSNYVRGAVESSDEWQSAAPVEAYAVTYGNGDQAKDVRVLMGQWADAEEAETQYEKLAKALDGEQLAAGNIKVSGQNTGSYVVVGGKGGGGTATALWRNDTVVFRVTGPQASVEAVYKLFPV
ncbi:hypothetical protein CQR45_0457 [Bifidobacterium pseudolongum subsp. globosum]|uniref:Uncharacterized protein n=2 Tax=Bifidobacterium pseudolongum TaxID=1694 RepID=A0A2N3QUB9_9BIFI|nr:hypothetical protein CQR45_0457 [Bifidobacterium pseudolongum subsp. globosum]